jgi:hypothetical protein
MLILVLAGASPSLYGQEQRAEIQKRLSTAFKRTTLTADRSDVAKAGTVLTLHKDNLLMCSMDAHASPTNTYKNGSISMGLGATMSWSMALSSVGQQVANTPQRKFVGGEKVWLADFQVKDDGVYLLFYSFRGKFKNAGQKSAVRNPTRSFFSSFRTRTASPPCGTGRIACAT